MKAVFHHIQSALLAELESAKESIEIAVAWFTNAILMECLLRKLSKGIKVTLVLNNDEINNNETNRSYFEQLISKGCKIHWINYPELMHQKFCIIDYKVVANGSYNWTYYAENHNRENIIILDSPNIAESFHQQFLSMLLEYPCCDEVPKVGRSGINNAEISRYRNTDRNLWANYQNDVPNYKLKTDWKQDSIVRVLVQSITNNNTTIKWGPDDSEKIISPTHLSNGFITEYDEDTIFGHANKIGRRYFKVFSSEQVDSVSVYDKDRLVYERSENVLIPQGTAVLLYSSYNVESEPNEHLAYRYNSNRIPVSISILSSKASELCFSIETMLGINEIFEVENQSGGLKIQYQSVPDGKCYYMVLRPQNDIDCSIHIESGSKALDYDISLRKGLIYYIGYICNLSNKYGTRKIFIQKGINK